MWAIKSKDHFLAAPVPVGTNIYTSGLGGFNRPTISLFPIASTGDPKPVWEHTARTCNCPRFHPPRSPAT